MLTEFTPLGPQLALRVGGWVGGVGSGWAGSGLGGPASWPRRPLRGVMTGAGQAQEDEYRLSRPIPPRLLLARVPPRQALLVKSAAGRQAAVRSELLREAERLVR